MPRRPALPKDPSQRAKAILDMATGETAKPKPPKLKSRNRAAHLKFCDHAGNGVALFACPAGFVYKRLVQTGNRHEATVRHSHVYGDRSGYFRFYIKVYPHEYRQTHKAGGVGRTLWQSGYAYVVAKDSN